MSFSLNYTLNSPTLQNYENFLNIKLTGHIAINHTLQNGMLTLVKKNIFFPLRYVYRFNKK